MQVRPVTSPCKPLTNGFCGNVWALPQALEKDYSVLNSGATGRRIIVHRCIKDFLETSLNKRSGGAHEERVQRIMTALVDLMERGISQNSKKMKYIKDDLYELRPNKSDRIFFFKKKGDFVAVGHIKKQRPHISDREMKPFYDRMKAFIETMGQSVIFLT